MEPEAVAPETVEPEELASDAPVGVFLPETAELESVVVEAAEPETAAPVAPEVLGVESVEVVEPEAVEVEAVEAVEAVIPDASAGIAETVEAAAPEVREAATVEDAVEPVAELNTPEPAALAEAAPVEVAAVEDTEEGETDASSEAVSPGIAAASGASPEDPDDHHTSPKTRTLEAIEEALSIEVEEPVAEVTEPEVTPESVEAAADDVSIEAMEVAEAVPEVAETAPEIEPVKSVEALAIEAPVAEEAAEDDVDASAEAVSPGLAAASGVPDDPDDPRHWISLARRAEPEADVVVDVPSVVSPVYGLKPGAEGEIVLRLQEVLDKAGYDPGRIDGRYDDRTETAVIDFQIDHELDPTGVVDAETDTALVPGGLITLVSGIEEDEEEEEGLVVATEEHADDDDEGGVRRRNTGDLLASLGVSEERADDWRIFDAVVGSQRIADLSAEALQSVGAAALIRSLAETGGTSRRLKIGDDLTWHHRADRSDALEAFALRQSSEAAIDALPKTRWQTGSPAEDARISGVVMMQGERWMVEQADAGAEWMREAADSTYSDVDDALSILGSATGGLW